MGQTYVGFAISDCNPQQRNLLEVLEFLNPADGVELQPEFGIWDVDAAMDLLCRCPFRTVHAPSNGIDISTPTEPKGEDDIRKTLASMDFAHRVGAGAFVIHPVNAEYPLNLDERQHRRRVFLHTFRNQIVPHYRDRGYTFDLCLENIEFSKYPAMLEELIELQETCSQWAPVKVVLDVPHIWNTRRIVQENEDRRRAMYQPSLDVGLVEQVAGFIEQYRDRIAFYHLANFGVDPVRTHDPITPTKIHPELKEILPLLSDKSIILEVYTGPRDKLKESERTVRSFVGSP
ncbi:MAG: TIM barrel protein [Phycisphaerae bacterium]|nr:TIM barrel protein [Phycisphaerae bacterium]